MLTLASCDVSEFWQGPETEKVPETTSLESNAWDPSYQVCVANVKLGFHAAPAVANCIHT